jgi:hypothetical protein
MSNLRERERENEQKKKTKFPTGRIGWSPTQIKMGVGCLDPSNLKRKCWANEKEKKTKRCCGLLLLYFIIIYYIDSVRV